MSIIQALLIGLFGWISSIYSPVAIGGLGGWYTMGRPLVSGMIIGIILGDVRTGIILGAAVQALYIGLVTPGGTMPADVNFAAWVGIPLAMVAGAGKEYALALAVPLSFLGIACAYSTVAINLYFVHRQDAMIEAGKLSAACKVPFFGQITNFAFRFLPIFLINYLGADVVTQVVAVIPEWFTNILQIFASLLPLVGFTLLLKMIVKKDIELILFVFGFIMVAVGGLQMIPIVIVAGLLAYLDFKYGSQGKEEA